MSLPILSHHPQPTAQDLIRFYHRCELHWCRQSAADETVLDVGTALCNREFPAVHSVNILLDASLPDEMTPETAFAMVEEHYQKTAGTRCWKWVLNPSAPIERTQPLADYLLSRGYARNNYDIMYLSGRPQPIMEVGGLTIIPARASFRHVRQLLEESYARWNLPQLIDEAMAHLDDPHTDALVALRDGAAVAWVSVLSVGEIGCIEEIYVAAKARRQGIGRTMLGRALEICARSLFKHVFLSCDPTNAAAIDLYRKIGFTRIGALTVYRAPADAT